MVGSQVRLPADDNTYTLYYLYPLDEQEETLALVSRALLTAGVPLLLLVAGLTWLVTRQVVTPIRMARRVAERLAAGQLQERLRVHRRGRPRPARRRRSTRWPPTCRSRSASSRSSAGSSAASSPTSPTSCARRSRRCGWPATCIHDARAVLDPVTARAAELLQNELDRFETLLADLLEISRFDAGAAVLEADDVNLVDVAHRVVDMTSAAGRPARHAGASSHDPGHAVHRRGRRTPGRADRAQPGHQRHRPRRDAATSRSSSAPTRHAAAIAVRDHGVGLGPGESAMVFNRFWRADPARARTSGGTGLGLSISLEDTHLHGGWLQAWGRPGEGAQFRLTLPRRARQPLRHSPLPLVPDDARETA